MSAVRTAAGMVVFALLVSLLVIIRPLRSYLPARRMYGIHYRCKEPGRASAVCRCRPWYKPDGDLDGLCSVEITRREAATGILFAGSDPRRDGWALAW